MDFDWKTLVRTVAPGIASVFGTPLAGLGVSALLNVLLPEGAEKPANPDTFLAQALQTANPEILLKIKQADQAFALDMKKLDIDLEKFVAENREKNMAGARMLKSDWLKSDKWDYEPLLALVIVFAFLGAEGWVFYYASLINHSMEPNQAVLVGRMLGIVDAAFMLLLNFRYGTSKSSERKTELAAEQTTQLIAGKP